MNEIELLYEYVGVNKIFKYYECSYGTSSIQVCPIPLGDCIGMCDRKSIWEYPPFTAEKQIELIKYLSKLGMFEIIECDYYQISLDFDVIWTDRLYVGEATTFEEALAKLIITIWEDISENTQEEIRSILRA